MVRKTNLALLPLRDIIIFPNMVIPLFVGREKSIKALNEVMKSDKKIILVTQINSEVDDPSSEDIYSYGCESSVLQLLKLPDGTVKVLVEGLNRVKISDFDQKNEFLKCSAEAVKNEESAEDLLPLALTAIKKLEKLSGINKKIPFESINNLKSLKDSSQIADNIASHLNISISDKQKIFEMLDVKKKINKIIEYLDNEISIVGVEKRIRGRVKNQMEKTQPEGILFE